MNHTTMPNLERPLRLLVFSSGDFFAGGQQYLVNLFNHLPRHQCRISCICTHQSQLHAIKARLAQPDDIDFILFQPNQTQTFRQMLFPLIALIASRQPDIVQFNGLESPLGGAAVLVAARLAKVPRTIAISHTTSHLRPRNGLEALLWDGCDLLLDGLIVITQRSVNEIPRYRHHIKTKLQLIHYGITFAENLSPATPQPIRKPAEPTSRHITIGILARLVPVKSVQTLLYAVALLHPKVSLRVRIIGDGEEYQYLTQITESLAIQSVVEFVGWTDTPWEELEKLDIFVLTSLSEGVPISILEAMWCSLPVIATDVGGVADAVVHGETGWLIPPQDPHRLAQALATLIANPAQRHLMGIRGKARAETYFSAARMAAATWAYYIQLLGYSSNSNELAHPPIHAQRG